jgi:hypothetical protein
MNKRPIEMAQDPDLRLSAVALQRAANRAHELARQTGTAVVISREGVVHYVQPTPVQTQAATVAQEQAARYAPKP